MGNGRLDPVYRNKDMNITPGRGVFTLNTTIYHLSSTLIQLPLALPGRSFLTSRGALLRTSTSMPTRSVPLRAAEMAFIPRHGPLFCEEIAYVDVSDGALRKYRKRVPKRSGGLTILSTPFLKISTTLPGIRSSLMRPVWGEAFGIYIKESVEGVRCGHTRSGVVQGGSLM